MKKAFLLAFCCLISILAQAQDTIKWKNPSFEDIPSRSRTPKHWDNCGFTNETPPDTQPGAFGVFKKADDGKTYLSLVTRDNDTYEAVGQMLNSPLKAGKTYAFTIKLFCSDILMSVSPITNKKENFDKPVYLKVWGAKEENKEAKLLYVSDSVISNRDWLLYEIKFKPMENVEYIIFEAALSKKKQHLYQLAFNGNIMLDNLSPIIELEK